MIIFVLHISLSACWRRGGEYLFVRLRLLWYFFKDLGRVKVGYLYFVIEWGPP